MGPYRLEVSRMEDRPFYRFEMLCDYPLVAWKMAGPFDGSLPRPRLAELASFAYRCMLEESK